MYSESQIKLVRAKELIKAGRREEAWRLLDQILAADPHNEEAWLWASKIATKSGKKRIVDKARRYLPSTSKIFVEEQADEGILSSYTNTINEKPKLNYLLLGGLLVLAAVFCSSAVLIMNNSNTFTRLFLPAPTRRPPITLAPTFTPLPTRTPTPSAQNSNFQAATQEDAGSAYLQEVILSFAPYQDAFLSFLDLHIELRQNPSRLHSSSWQSDAVYALGSMLVYSEQWANISPVPPRFHSFHNILLEIHQETVRYYDNYLIAVATGDTQRIIAAAAQAETIPDLYDQVAQEMQRLRDDH